MSNSGNGVPAAKSAPVDISEREQDSTSDLPAEECKSAMDQDLSDVRSRTHILATESENSRPRKVRHLPQAMPSPCSLTFRKRFDPCCSGPVVQDLHPNPES